MSRTQLHKLKRQAKRGVKAVLPYGAVVVYRRHKSTKNTNYCPICNQKGEFLPMSSTGGVRQRAVCPNCYSLERHRLTWLFINRTIGLENLKNKFMLHVAAEPSFGPKLREVVGKKYSTADLLEEADIKMDITDIEYPDNSFDYIICNHVLEHVDDDVKAMKELRRVQKKDGWAILLAPVADMPTTYEDKKITSKKGRLRAFGQEDHVRKYGKDYLDRLKTAGYKVNVYKASDVATKQEIRQMSLKENSKLWGFTSTEIYFCTK